MTKFPVRILGLTLALALGAAHAAAQTTAPTAPSASPPAAEAPAAAPSAAPPVAPPVAPAPAPAPEPAVSPAPTPAPAPLPVAAPPAEIPPAAAPAPADAPPPEASKPKPPPYSLPWSLRGVVPANVIRSDTAVGWYQSKSTRGGSATASMLLFSYKVLPDLAPLVRLGLVNNSPPTDKSARTNILNPVIGALYGPKIHPNFKLGFFVGMTLPIGSGGGDKPHVAAGPANQAGAAVRSSMDNAMFAVNYLALFPGLGVAYVRSGFTVQAEATVFRLWKTRGPSTIDKTNVNFTSGLHLGYFFVPQLSVGTEIRHQRWFSSPSAPPVNKDKTDTLRDNSTVAFGPRAHFKLGDSMWLRPGIALALPIDNPLAFGPSRKAAANSHFKMVQIDIPFIF